MTGVAGWERNDVKVRCSFKNSSSGAKFKLSDDLSPEGGQGAGLTGASDVVDPPIDPPIEPPREPPDANPAACVSGDNRLVAEVPLVTPPLPKLLKERSCGRGEGVGAALRGHSAVGVLAVGLAIGVPQNSTRK